MHQSSTILLLTSLMTLAIVVHANYGGYGSYEAPALKLKKPFIPIVRLLESSDNYGNYNFDALSADGTAQAESGSLRNIDGHIGSVKSGSYSWISPEGQHFSLSYTADENGFHPVASHLPTPPPVPVEILKTLNNYPEQTPYHSGQYYHQQHFSGSPMAHFAAPVVAPIVPILVGPIGSTKTFVQTPEFLIDSDMSKTIVRIGQ